MVLDLEGSLVRSKPDLHRPSAHHLSIHLSLRLLGVLSVVHAQEGEVLLAVVEHLAHLSVLAQISLQTLLRHAGTNVADVEPRPTTELPLGSINGRQLVSRTLDLLQALHGEVLSASSPASLATLVSTSTAATSALEPAATPA